MGAIATSTLHAILTFDYQPYAYFDYALDTLCAKIASMIYFDEKYSSASQAFDKAKRHAH